jgi:hypothetical protein
LLHGGVLVFGTVLSASVARAAEYELPPDRLERESDLSALEQRGDVTADTAQALRALMRAKVDLNRASREELYELPGLTFADVDAIVLFRQQHGKIDKPSQLLEAGVLGDAKLRAIAAFVAVDKHQPLPLDGTARLLTAASNGDFLEPYRGPPVLFDGRVDLPWHLNAGVLLETTRLQPDSPRYDSIRDALVVDPIGYRVPLPDAFLQWRGAQTRVVLGSFNIGFAERLTFDSTRHVEPQGIVVDDLFRRPWSSARAPGERDLYVTDDFIVRQPLRGLAASVEDLDLGRARLSLYGWLSYQWRSLYQYELYDRRTCADPHDDRLSGCAPPNVFIVHGDDLTRDAPLQFATLPQLYEELLGGAHAEVKAFDRWRFGVTGFGAKNFWHDAPLELDTQEWSHVPRGGPFAALGADVRAVFGELRLMLEATRSVDSIAGGGGGYGVVQRTVFSRKNDELEVSLRYYDDKFVDPYARPPSAPDELDGQRARNEAGVRARYSGALPWELRLLARADFWVLPYGDQAGTTNLYALVRLSWWRFERFVPSVWIDLRNRDLAHNGFGACASGEAVPGSTCSDDLYRVAARADFVVDERWLQGAVESAFTLRDDPRYRDQFRQDAMAWLELRSHLTEWLHARLRSKYLHEDLATDDAREESLWTWLELAYVPNRTFEAEGRYDVYLWLDKRPSTLARRPNPEHRFFLDVTYRF